MARPTTLLKVNTENMKSINDDCNGDIEMQMLVRSFIAEKKDGGKNLKDSMQEMAEKRRARKLCPAAGLSPAADEAETVIPEDMVLPKNCKKYAGWKVGLLEELFQYCEPRTFSSAKREIDSLQNARQILEYAFELKAGLVDGRTDSITTIAKGSTIYKKVCFDALRSLYRALGSRLRDLVIVEGNVVWLNQGIYRIERLQAVDESQYRTTVYNRFMDRRADIPSDLVEGMSLEDLEVFQNFSLDTAYVNVRTGGTLVLESLFPRIHHHARKLRRRLSDELGVTQAEQHGVSPPPAKKPKTAAAEGALSPKVPSPPSELVGSKAGGAGATPALPGLEPSEDEAMAPEEEEHGEPDEE